MDWDGVSRADRARLIGGQLDAYEMAVLTIRVHQYHAAIDLPELIERAPELQAAEQTRWRREQAGYAMELAAVERAQQRREGTAAEEGEYQVWHISDYGRALLDWHRDAGDAAFPGAYTRVATVEADSLDQVFALTNHGENSWQENPGVVGIGTRSTSVGDVIVDPLGRPYRVENTGFSEVPSPDETPLERIERRLREMKRGPEIYLESTRDYVQPIPGDVESIYETCDVLGPWHTLDDADKLRVLGAEFDWRDVGPEDKRRVMEREVDFARVPEDARKHFPDEAAHQGSDNGGATLGPPGRGEFQVWHDRGWPQSRLDQMLGSTPPSSFPQDYFHAADVEAGSLREAVGLTTGKGSVLTGDEVPWEGNPGVQSHTPKPFVPRNTDAGDVIVDPEGKAHRYDGQGFSEIAFGRDDRRIADDAAPCAVSEQRRVS